MFWIMLPGILLLIINGCAAISSPRPLPDRQAVVNALGLVPMDDGVCIGFYKEMYASEIKADHAKRRSASSLIYYLMTGGLFDPWHKISSDEILVYHAGAAMSQLLVYPDGRMEEFVLGPDPTLGHVLQVIIPADVWMGFRIMNDNPDAWGLYGVFCSPGWHLDDISLITGQELGRQFPEAIEAMKRLRMYQ